MDAPAEVRIVLLGKTGSGKSSAGNVILGEEKFRVSCFLKNTIQNCQTEEGNVNGRKVTVTDTPGIIDTERSDHTLKYSIISCLTECAPGPHAFILVLRVGKYTQEEEESVRMILKWFGKEALKHTVILFTHGDELDKHQSIKQFVEKNKDLKEFVDKCGNRVHVIDSKYWKKKDGELGQGSGRLTSTGTYSYESEYRSNSFQIKQLLTTIDNMVTKNGGCYYTNESLQIIAESIQDEANKMKQESKIEQHEMWKEASKTTRNKILKSKVAGSAVGSLLGFLLGVPVGAAVPVVLLVGLLTATVKSVFGGRTAQKVNVKAIALEVVSEVAARGTDIRAAETEGAATYVGAVLGMSGVKAEIALAVIGAGLLARIGLAAAAGVFAIAGAVRGGIAGAKAGETWINTNRAAKEAAKAAGQAGLNTLKEVWDATQKLARSKDSELD